MIYLANQACITFHVWLSRIDRVDHPDRMVLDLDPSDEDFAKVRWAAREARALLEELGLAPFLQVTGSRGLHVWVPLDGSADFDQVRQFASEVAERLVARRPRELTTAQRKAKRGDRVFVDVARNAYAQTAVAPYSVRARPQAPVASPIDGRSWRIQARTAALHDPQHLSPAGAPARPWAEIERHARPLHAARERLAALAAWPATPGARRGRSS